MISDAIMELNPKDCGSGSSEFGTMTVGEKFGRCTMSDLMFASDIRDLVILRTYFNLQYQLNVHFYLI